MWKNGASTALKGSVVGTIFDPLQLMHTHTHPLVFMNFFCNPFQSNGHCFLFQSHAKLLFDFPYEIIKGLYCLSYHLSLLFVFLPVGSAGKRRRIIIQDVSLLPLSLFKSITCYV